MKKRTYNEPVVEVIAIEMEDIICVSKGDNDSSWWDGSAASATSVE